MKKITILIADDHSVVRRGLSALFSTEPDFKVIATAKDGAEAVRMSADLDPDVIVMDLMMPGLNGIDATRQITTRPENEGRPAVLILTTFATSDGIIHALNAGAAGAVLKTAPDNELIDAIRRIAAGEKRCLSTEVQELLNEDPPVEELTPRQLEILDDVTRGLTNSDIAKHFGIREASVKEHLVSIFGRIGASNRAEAVSIALRKHLLKI